MLHRHPITTGSFKYARGANVTLKELHHCSIRTNKLEETKSFYEHILGMRVGNRPPFPFPGYWLYVEGAPVVHLIGIDPNDPSGLYEYLGGQKESLDSGTGPFDHVAFIINDPDAMRERFAAGSIEFLERKVPDMDLEQFFLEDPNGITVELNYISTDGPNVFDDSVTPQIKAAPTMRETILGRAGDFAPVLKERSAAAEAAGRLSDETIAEFEEAQLWQVTQPKRVGGLELEFSAMLETTAEIARSCGSTGWIHSNLASHHWMIAMFPEQAQNDVWGENPNTYTSTSLIYPAGKAKRVRNGYELTGRWPFCSGILHSDWIMLGGIVAGKTNKDPTEPRIFLLPKSEIKLIDNWDVTGLVATGSVDSKVEKVFVPAHRTLAAADVCGGPTPGAEVNPSPLYQLPLAGLFPHLIAVPVTGMARGVNDTCVETMRSRISTYDKSNVSAHSTSQLRVSNAMAAADMAMAVILHSCQEAETIAALGEIPSIEAKMRWRRDAAFVTSNVVQYADQLCRSQGGGSIYKKNPLQQKYRDMRAGLTHIGVSNDINGVGYGRIALGFEPDNPMI